MGKFVKKFNDSEIMHFLPCKMKYYPSTFVSHILDYYLKTLFQFANQIGAATGCYVQSFSPV